MQVQKLVQGWLQTYSTRLAIGLFLLIVATTLSAGVPAYWLTHVQLNQQVTTHLRDAQQSTLSLLNIEHARLANVAFLFAERPTLATLLDEMGDPPFAPEEAASLLAYIANFQQQIDLDLLLICAPDRSLIVGSPEIANKLDHCPANDGFLWVGDRATLVARRSLMADGSALSSEELARASVIVGVWLDQPFMNQLAAATGMEQSLIDVNGRRLVSSLAGIAIENGTGDSRVGDSRVGMLQADGQFTHTALQTPTTLQLNGHTYWQLLAPLSNADDQVIFYSEILLNADALFATRNRVLGILLFSTGVVALLGVALGVWSIRRVTSPLALLTAQAERISQGEFETPIPPLDGPVEVQTLAAALRRSQASIVQALEDRAAARDRLDNLVQSLVEGVVIIDAQGKITFWNHAAAMITGWPSEQAFGKKLDLVLPLVEPHQPTLLNQLPLPGQRRRVAVLTSGGKSSTLEVTSVRSTGGNPRNDASVRGGGEDHALYERALHERALHERALVMRDVTEEEATHHLRAYFLANISHEFRTPLSTLNASMEILMDESEERSGQLDSARMMSGAEMRALLKPIHLSLLELQMLIDNLLEGSTIEAGEFRLRRRVLTLSEPIQGALTVVQPVLERRQQTLSVTVPAKLEPIWADRVRLTQVLVNLLVNASKYTPMGEAIDITVLRLKDEGYRVMVADRGPGIPEVERVNLFRRFVRLDSSQTNKAGDQKADVHGTGIGLYVVKTAIEAHGGRVGIEDRKGGGAIFWFEIPRGEIPT